MSEKKVVFYYVHEKEKQDWKTNYGLKSLLGQLTLSFPQLFPSRYLSFYPMSQKLDEILSYDYVICLSHEAYLFLKNNLSEHTHSLCLIECKNLNSRNRCLSDRYSRIRSHIQLNQLYKDIHKQIMNKEESLC